MPPSNLTAISPSMASLSARPALSRRSIAALQNSVDAAAIEIERLGEGQRFTTKLLSERPAPIQNQPR